MNRLTLFFLIALCSAAFADSSLAAPAVKQGSGVAASVRTDGAMIYSKPDFDSELLTTLKQGDKVRVSSGATGDFAKFHKVRVGSILGYIADIDVQIEGAPKKRDHVRKFGEDGKDGKKHKLKKDAKADDKKKKFKDQSLPILFTKYVGVLIGFSEFNEAITGVSSKENLLVYGLKITGPDVLLNGPIMDLNLAFHYGAPSYYTALSSTKPSGFVLMADALLLLPFFQRDLTMISIGLGPALRFSNFTVTSGGEPKSLTQLDLALSAALGGGFKLGKVAVRLEGKYLFGKQTDRLIQASVQQAF